MGMSNQIFTPDGRFFVFDLDGTLANVDHRQEHALNKNWDAFHFLCHLDRPYQNIVDLMSAISENWKIIIITGRDEKYRKATEHWLDANEIFPDALFMRQKDDRRPDHEYKLEIIDSICGSRVSALESVIAWFDDRDNLVAKLRDAGFTICQVKAGAY
jgi:phosphoserine phosphatase